MTFSWCRISYTFAAEAVGTSLIAFIVVYFLLFGAGTFYILRLMKSPPHPGEEEPSRDEPTRTAGITPAAMGLHPDAHVAGHPVTHPAE